MVIGYMIMDNPQMEHTARAKKSAAGAVSETERQWAYFKFFEL